VVRPKEGDVLVGRWVKGAREGPGNVSTPRLEKGGVKAMVGSYTGGRLDGQAKMVMADGTCRQCWVQRGWLHGPCRGVRQDGEQKLAYLGHYAAGKPKGVCWTAIKGGGWIIGRQDSKAEYTGDNIAFLYPDLSTALVGKFLQGILVSARSAVVASSSLVDGVLVPSYSFLSDQKFSYWPSTLDRVLCPPHQRDPYETRLVRVGTSQMDGGGEGLFAKRFIASGTIVAFYNGVRIGQEESNPHGTTGYCIFVDWGKQLPFPFPWVKEGDQIDIPAMYQSSEDYTATLAHKVNHSFITNCEFTNFCHPCYGLLPAIVTTTDVAKDEELFTNYSLDMKEAPEWYLSCWELVDS